jgi:hypothetical protein
VEFARAPALVPVPIRYGPGWLPGGLREVRRSVSVSGSPSTSVHRLWTREEDAPAMAGAATQLTEFRDDGSPYLSIVVDHDPPDTVQLNRSIDVAVAEGGLFWNPEPRVTVHVDQRGLGLDPATLERIARSVRPVPDEVAFPLQVAELPAGLTELSWNSFVSAELRPEPGTDRWRGTVNWCFPFEITVDGSGPAEARAWLLPGHRSLAPMGERQIWYGRRDLGRGYGKTMLALEKRPGTVVTVSLLTHGRPSLTKADFTRIADAVEVRQTLSPNPAP